MKILFQNGTVFTPGIGFSDSFFVEGGRFSLADPHEKPDEVVDLGGKFVCPGFIDTHLHLVAYGRALCSCTLDEHTGSLAAVCEYMREYLRKTPLSNGKWLYARGWNDDNFTDVHRPINRHDLDRVSTEVPIYAGRTCGHCVCVNTKALEVMGVTLDTQAPDGGRIGVENGELTGMFFDNAINLIRTAMPNPDAEEIKHYITAACKVLNSFGVTGAMTDDFTALYRWPNVTKAYQELATDGKLPVRIYQQCYFDTPEGLNAFNEAGFTTGVGTDLYRIGPLKMIADGAVGAHTAYLSKPYNDADTCGTEIYDQETLDTMIGLAHRKGMQVAIHAIGDGCIDMVMNAYEKAITENPREDHRHTLIHCLVTRPDQLPRMKKLGLRVHFQSEFLDYHCRIAEQRLGKERANQAYAWKSMKKLGIGVSNSSDAPVEIPSPLRGIQLAITRQSLDGSGEALNLNEAFTLEEAIAGYTSDAVVASFDENCKGKILPGFLADFIILDTNPFETPVDSIVKINVLETWMGGKKVYSRDA